MNKIKKRSWVTRLRLVSQSARKLVSTQFRRIPQQPRLILVTSLCCLITALFISHYPLSVIPEYRAGEIAFSDITVPAELIAKDESDLSASPSLFNRNTLVMRAGEIVTPEKLRLIDAVRNYQLDEREPKRLIGLIFLISLLFFALYKAAVSSQSSRLTPQTAYWVAGSALVIQMLLVRGGMFGAAVLSTRPETMEFGEMFEFQFAIPFAACALVLSLLVGTQVALVASLICAILTGFVSPHSLAMSAYALAGSVTAVYSVQRYRTRNAVIVASVVVGVVNIAMGLVASLIASREFDFQRMLGGVGLCLLGALLTAATASFAIPIYESFFDILTDMKLLELSNADNALLRQLAIQTPGTSHHSYMVGILAEEAAKSIGANALLARTGCLYHDIGKLAAPSMYIENQKGGPNPHDKVSPLDSVRIITGHVRRGIRMAREADLPWQIIDFIPQHHGTRVLAYFYHKAKAQAEARGEVVNIDDFRYPGPKPQTKEAVILMLADGAEASVRSLDEPTPENIRAIIKKIVDSVVADGQLEESDITVRELTTIRESLVNTLINVYHQRIRYPGFNPQTDQLSETEKREEVPGELNGAGFLHPPAPAAVRSEQKVFSEQVRPSRTLL
ncbi:MAG: HDIG domain-containing protein [Acidobacteria bacterium]|nr:HDIG domain-containing protein [Acidobacteriota bacterium]